MNDREKEMATATEGDDALKTGRQNRGAQESFQTRLGSGRRERRRSPGDNQAACSACGVRTNVKSKAARAENEGSLDVFIGIEDRKRKAASCRCVEPATRIESGG